MYRQPLTLDRALSFPATETRMRYADSVAEEKDIPTALNALFVSLTEKLAKFCLFPLSIQTGWGEEWTGYEMIPSGIFYVSVNENMFFRNHGLGRSFKRQEHLRLSAQYNSNLNEIHIYFNCLGDYELAEPIIKEFFSLRSNLNIRCLVLYCFEDRLPEGESTAEAKLQKLERVFFAGT